MKKLELEKKELHEVFLSKFLKLISFYFIFKWTMKNFDKHLFFKFLNGLLNCFENVNFLPTFKFLKPLCNKPT